MKSVVCFSGGLDSSVLLAEEATLHGPNKIGAFSVDYGQRHSRELVAARDVAKHYGIEHLVLDLSGLKSILGSSALTDSAVAVPYGHYTDKTMEATVVPNRNMILLSVATAWAVSRGANTVKFSAHAGDHAIYPDCRPAFSEALALAILLANKNPVILAGPYLDLTKAEIVKRGSQLNVPFGLTWSCYEGKNEHCGKCGTCVERREAFTLADVTDPTRYRGEN